MSSSNAWTDSFANIKCYDSLKIQAVLNWIDGLNHDGTALAKVPNVFGMNFQTVSVGEKLVESSIGTTGGYLDAKGTPSPALKEGLKKIGDQLTADWIKRAGPDGEAVIAAYKKM